MGPGKVEALWARLQPSLKACARWPSSNPLACSLLGTLAGAGIACALARTDDYLVWTLGCVTLLFCLGCALFSGRRGPQGPPRAHSFFLGEVMGYLLAVAGMVGPSWLAVLLAFLAFRCFHALALPPAGWLSRLGGGPGLFLGEIVAGLYAFTVLTVARSLLPDLIWTAS